MALHLIRPQRVTKMYGYVHLLHTRAHMNAYALACTHTHTHAHMRACAHTHTLQI